jgi:7-carboxy-7-deazaguanine synthase
MSLQTTDKAERLKVSEIFYSLQGEAATTGLPTVFVRLTGCPLRCSYCDTEYAFTGGQWFTLDEILDQVKSYGTPYVTVTGGEPLAQKNCLVLMQRLCDTGFDVSLETSGAIDVSAVDSRVSKVVDIKTPGSGEVDKNLLTNLGYLSSRDQLKFVICDQQDYTWSRDFIKQHALQGCCDILFSPSYQQLEARLLADWILRDKLVVRLQIQLHKLLWGDRAGV